MYILYVYKVRRRVIVADHANRVGDRGITVVRFGIR